MTYFHWALLGMVGYSTVTLCVKLATRSGDFSSFLVLSIACLVVLISTLTITWLRGDFSQVKAADLVSSSALWSYATGIALAVAVTSLFKALSMGPASEVVPVYGMFIVGGALLGIVFLGESLHWQKVVGIITAAISIYLITQ